MSQEYFFSAQDLMKGIRLLYNEMDLNKFKSCFFPSDKYTEEYIAGYWKTWFDSPFHFWCSLDKDRQEMLEFMISDATDKELAYEKKKVIE